MPLNHLAPVATGAYVLGSPGTVSNGATVLGRLPSPGTVRGLRHTPSLSVKEVTSFVLKLQTEAGFRFGTHCLCSCSEGTYGDLPLPCSSLLVSPQKEIIKDAA